MKANVKDARCGSRARTTVSDTRKVVMASSQTSLVKLMRCVCTCVYVFAGLYVCVLVFVFLYVRACVCVCVHARMHTQVCNTMYMCTYVCVTVRTTVICSRRFGFAPKRSCAKSLRCIVKQTKVLRTAIKSTISVLFPVTSELPFICFVMFFVLAGLLVHIVLIVLTTHT